METLPAKIDSQLQKKVQVCDNINTHLELQPNEVIIHALHDSLPSCSLASGTHTLENIESGSVCKIYCAQETCSAAIDYINQHKRVFEKCDSVLYLHEGSISIESSLLQDGETCHKKIKEYNAPSNF